MQSDIGLTSRLRAMPTTRQVEAVFDPSEQHACARYLGSFDHLHSNVRRDLNLPGGFVLHSLRHTCLARLGKYGAGAFEILKLDGHSSLTLFQGYGHPPLKLWGRQRKEWT